MNMTEFVGGPDVKMDGLSFKEETEVESPRSPLYTLFPNNLLRSPFQESDDSEDSCFSEKRGSELRKLRGKLTKLSVAIENTHDLEEDDASTASAPDLEDPACSDTFRRLASSKTMPLTKVEKKAVAGSAPAVPIVENAPSRSPPAIPWPINKVLSPIRTKLDPSSPRSSRSPSPAELPPEPTTPRAWERSEASQIFTPPAHSHLPGEAEIEQLLLHAPPPGKSPLRVSS